MVADGELRVDPGANATLSPSVLSELPAADAVLVSGYLPSLSLEAALARAQADWVLLDAARAVRAARGRQRRRRERAAGTGFDRRRARKRRSVVLGERYRLACVTLGARGAVGRARRPARAGEPADRALQEAPGAGDAFAAALLVALARGASLLRCARGRLPLRRRGGPLPRLAGGDRIRGTGGASKGGAVKVIVVGAGLSGLVSGMRLQEAGHEVVVLEARDRVGGRVLTVRDGFEDGQYADVGAMILYEGQPNILELCRALRARADAAGHVRRGAARAALRRQAARPGDGRRGLRGARRRARAGAAGAVRDGRGLEPARRLSATPYAFLEALIQIQPSIPLRYVDAHTLHLGPEVFCQIAGGNDQLPRLIAEGLDVRLGQPVRTIGWSGPGVTVETESETLSGDLLVVAVPGPLTTELGWDPPLPAGEGRRARVAALRHRRRRRHPVRRDGHGPRGDPDRRLHRPAAELVPRRLGRPARRSRSSSSRS